MYILIFITEAVLCIIFPFLYVPVLKVGMKITLKMNILYFCFGNRFNLWTQRQGRRVDGSKLRDWNWHIYTVLCCAFVTSWTVAHQALLSMGILQARILEWIAYPFSRGSSWPRIELGSPALQADSLPTEVSGKPQNHCQIQCHEAFPLYFLLGSYSFRSYI